MSLSKINYLYRVRVLFKPDGAIDAVETVHRNCIVENGEVVSQAGEDVKTYTSAKMADAVAKLLTEIARVGAEDDAEVEAKRQAKEAERARGAAEAKAAQDASAAEATKAAKRKKRT